MRIGLTLVLAAGLSMPAMAAEVITTPGVDAVPSTPGVIVTPGANNAEHHMNKAARAQERANEAAANSNYGIAQHEQEKADRNLNKAQRDSSGTVTVIQR